VHKPGETRHAKGLACQNRLLAGPEFVFLLHKFHRFQSSGVALAKSLEVDGMLPFQSSVQRTQGHGMGKKKVDDAMTRLDERHG
jgi:hypothetical protein